MNLVVSAKPLYQDGTEGDDKQQEIVIGDARENAAAIGGWLYGRAQEWLGTEVEHRSGGMTECDAIDVTISRTSP